MRNKWLLRSLFALILFAPPLALRSVRGEDDGPAKVSASDETARRNKYLPRATPESQGISSADLLAYITEADESIDSMHSLMLVRHGTVVAEAYWSPYSAEDPHMLFSLSKSFTSTAVGLAIAEGKLRLSDEIVKFFPQDLPPEPAKYLASMRIRDLLTMSSGQRDEDIAAFSFAADGSLTKHFLAMDVPYKPGTHFCYNTPATYMCSAIVQQVTGQTVADYLQPRLFGPLGIDKPLWSMSPQGISHGGYGLNLRSEDIAKFGQLYLQEGRWNGQQLIPESWVELSTSRQMSNGSNPDSDWEQGYGFQFWRCRHGAFRGDGAHGQFCIVMPQYDAVLAITSGTRDMGSVMSLAWKHLLPALRDQALPEDADAEFRLRQKLSSLSMKLPMGEASTDLARITSGHVFSYPDNTDGTKTLQLTFEDTGQAVLKVSNASGEYAFDISHASWSRSRSNSIWAIDLRRVAKPADQGYSAAGAWLAADTYQVKLVLYETPYYQTLTFKFGDSSLSIEQDYNVSRGEGYPLAGTAELKP